MQQRRAKATKVVRQSVFIIASFLAVGSSSITGITGPQATTAYAATPPDSCFAFDTVTGTVTGYYDNEGDNPANPTCTRDVDIPSTISGIDVTTIGASAFASSNLTSVTIPSSVTTIDNYAFQDNSLTSIVIPALVTNIGNFSFAINPLQTATILGNPTMASPYVTRTLPTEFEASISTCGNQLDPPAQDFPDFAPCYASAAASFTSSRNFVKYFVPTPTSLADFGQVFVDATYAPLIGVPAATVYYGALINPTAVAVHYVDSNGNIIQAPQQVAGAHTDGTYITSYQLGDAGLPVLADPENPTPTEQSQMDAALAQYYRIGQNINLTPPAITGYTAPDAQSIVLADSGNEITFVYGGGSAGNQDDDLLAETGVSAPLALAIGIIVATASTTVLIRRLR